MNLELKHVSKSYDHGKTYALRDTNLTIQPGIFGLLGPNGAGKTTLMRIIATSMLGSKGQIHCGELDWAKPTQVRKQLGYLPQHYESFGMLTVRETLGQAAFFKGITGNRAVNEEIDEMLENVHLKEAANKRVSKLSGGMLRRLGIAQAMIGHPAILVIDEPSAGLDPGERMHMRKLLRNYNDGSGITIISSHIVEDMETICDTVAIMNHGEICAHGSVEALCAKVEPFVCEEDMAMDEYLQLEKDHLVINYRPVGERVHVRYIAHRENPPRNPVPARLEDSYLALIGGESAYEAMVDGNSL